MKGPVMDPWEVLESFQGHQFDRLYQCPYAASAIFKKRIGELAQSVAMTMLHVPRPIARSDLEMFLGLGSSRAVDQALATLRKYHMVKQINLGGVDSFFLTRGFSKSLKSALDSDSNSTRVRSDAMKLPAMAAVTAAALDEYAARQITSIINFVIGSATTTDSTESASSSPSERTIQLLETGGLIAYSGPERTPGQVKLLHNGFSFVVEKLDTQLWALIFLFIRTMRATGSDEVDALSFVCLVSSLEPGSSYSTITLRKEQMQLLEFLSTLGIVLLNQRPNSKAISSYVPTRLATLLASEIDPKTVAEGSPLKSLLSSNTDPSDGFINVDNNFRISAHPLTPVQISLLSLFVNVESRQSNKLSGTISQSSIHRAVQQGISASQIISYLNTHAHPKMRAAARRQQALQGCRATGAIATPLPAAIADQIRGWELEQDRVTTAAEGLVKDLEACMVLDASRKRADEMNVNMLSRVDPQANAAPQSRPASMGVVESA